MKRLVITAASLLLVLLMQTAVCFAGTLEIAESYPQDGETGRTPTNCAVKLYFNQNISSAENAEANSKFVKLTDSENKAQPIEVLYDSKNEKYVLVVVDGDLESDSEYKLTVAEGFMAASGDTLAGDETITFKTRNIDTDTKISMAMMVVMFVGIMFFSSRQMKRQAEKAANEGRREDKVNPYKVSKETGKSVVDIVEKTEKQKRKKAAAEAKMKAKESGADESSEDEAESDSDNKRVKGPRPIAAGGSAYLSGKKAKAEAEAARKAAAWAAGTTRPKNRVQKSKGKKK